MKNLDETEVSQAKHSKRFRKIMSTTPYTDAIISIPIRCEGPKVYTLAGRTITMHEVFLLIFYIFMIIRLVVHQSVMVLEDLHGMLQKF